MIISCACELEVELRDLPAHMAKEHKKSMPFGCGVCDFHFASEADYILGTKEDVH